MDQRGKVQLWRLEQSNLIICAKNERYICYDAFKFIRRSSLFIYHALLHKRRLFSPSEQICFFKNCVCFWNMNAFFKCSSTHLFMMLSNIVFNLQRKSDILDNLAVVQAQKASFSTFPVAAQHTPFPDHTVIPWWLKH